MITLSKSKLLKFAELSELQIDGRSEFAYTNRLEHFAELVLSDLDVCMEHVPENGEPHQQLAALKAELREICAAIDDPACDLTLTAVECIKKLKAENEWQPIETAPRDKSRVMFYINDPRLELKIALGTPWFYRDGEFGGGAEGFNGEWNITHWMPLPKPPAIKGEQW